MYEIVQELEGGRVIRARAETAEEMDRACARALLGLLAPAAGDLWVMLPGESRGVWFLDYCRERGIGRRQ